MAVYGVTNLSAQSVPAGGAKNILAVRSVSKPLTILAWGVFCRNSNLTPASYGIQFIARVFATGSSLSGDALHSVVDPSPISLKTRNKITVVRLFKAFENYTIGGITDPDANDKNIQVAPDTGYEFTAPPGQELCLQDDEIFAIEAAAGADYAIPVTAFITVRE
jgi:hypothetical protein